MRLMSRTPLIIPCILYGVLHFHRPTYLLLGMVRYREGYDVREGCVRPGRPLLNLYLSKIEVGVIWLSVCPVQRELRCERRVCQANETSLKSVPVLNRSESYVLIAVSMPVPSCFDPSLMAVSS